MSEPCCDLIQLPEDPNPAISIVLKKLTGGDVPVGELAHAGVHLQAWAVGRMHDHPTPDPAPKYGECRKTDRATLKSYCEQVQDCCAKETGTVKAGPFPVPVKPFVMLLLQALAEWLAGQDF